MCSLVRVIKKYSVTQEVIHLQLNEQFFLYPNCDFYFEIKTISLNYLLLTAGERAKDNLKIYAQMSK